MKSNFHLIVDYRNILLFSISYSCFYIENPHFKAKNRYFWVIRILSLVDYK